MTLDPPAGAVAVGLTAGVDEAAGVELIVIDGVSEAAGIEVEAAVADGAAAAAAVSDAPPAITVAVID